MSEKVKEAGLIERRRCRLTGLQVGLYNGLKSGFDADEESPWVTMCEEHGNLVNHQTLRLARSHMVVPEWCEECQKIMEARELSRKALKKVGQYVQYWFDTGCRGCVWLLGVVVEAGPKAYRVRWESGQHNRIRQDNPNVKSVTSATLLDEAKKLFNP
jgi:hypothetical protein